MTYEYQDGDQALGKSVYNADLTVTTISTYYHLQNSVWVKVGVISETMQAQGRMESMMSYVNLALKYEYIPNYLHSTPSQDGSCFIGQDVLECMRFYVASGKYSMAQVEATLGTTYLTHIGPSDFMDAPSTLSTAVVGSNNFFWTGGNISALEYMRKMSTVTDLDGLCYFSGQTA